jgi:uncharacterized protein YwgA
MARSFSEILADRLLLLWLLYDALMFKKFGDTKAQKLTYLSELDMIDNREKGFNYDFIKMPYGPYSEQLQKDIVWLEEQKLVESIPINEGKLFQKSCFGIKLLEDFHALFLRNTLFTIKIHKTNTLYAPKNSRELVELVHSFPHPYIKGKTINDLKNGTIILYKLVEEKARTMFDITPQELATLDIYLDDENYKSVMEASESAKRKPLLHFDEVF